MRHVRRQPVEIEGSAFRFLDLPERDALQSGGQQHGLAAILHVECLEDGAHMQLHRALSDAQMPRDARIRFALSRKRQDFELPVGQPKLAKRFSVLRRPRFMGLRKIWRCVGAIGATAENKSKNAAGHRARVRFR